jgi:hypothetical protein
VAALERTSPSNSSRTNARHGNASIQRAGFGRLRLG